MYNHIKKKIQASTILFTLGMLMFFPVMTTQENLTNPLALENTNWWNTTWPYRKLLTIDHTKIASDLTDFTVLIDISSDSKLATKAQDDGDDITFVLYSDNTTQLNHELELFNGTTGRTVAWVNITSLSSTFDTKIWLYYGNTNCPSQQNVIGAWDSHYVVVQHLEETSGIINDSTQYNNDGTAYGSMNLSAPGKMDGADFFDGADYIEIPHTTSLQLSSAISIEIWAKASNFSTYRAIATKDKTGTGATSEWWFGYSSDNRLLMLFNAGTYRYGNTVITDTSWHYLSGVYNGTHIALFLDGVSDNTPVANANINPDDGTVNLGMTKYWGGFYYKGFLDEFRISNIARNSSWIRTSYNNHQDPESFISIGAEESFQYTLTLTTSGTGSGTIQANPIGPYSYGTMVTIWANASAGSTFTGFNGALTGTTTPQILIIDENTAVDAQFTLMEYTLTITTQGSGTVTKNPNQTTYTYGQMVTLTAAPGTGWMFNSWSGDLTGSQNPKTITMNADKSVIANFTVTQYTLMITINGSGSVTKNPDQPTYTYGQVVNLTAIPATDWAFDHWTGNLTGNQNPANLTITENTQVTATFVSGNNPPVAVNDTLTVIENSQNIDIDVLANDYDPDNDTLSIQSVTQPLHGVSSQDGSYVYYTPQSSYTGSDSFQYNISDGKGGTSFAMVVITVKTENNPPCDPSILLPHDGDTDVSITTDLGWSGGDPDPGDIVLYDVYFGTSSTPPKVKSNQSALSYTPGTLLYNTTYYWKIVAWDTHGASSISSVWHFTTQQKEQQEINVDITRPLENSFYLWNLQVFSSLQTTIVFGPITITATVTAENEVDRVEFYIDGTLKKTDTLSPYTYPWITLKMFNHVIMVQAYDTQGNTASDELTVFKL